MDIDEIIHNFHQLWEMRPWPVLLLVLGFAVFVGIVVDVWIIKKRRRRH
jgi:hypothetical protein